MQLCVFVEHNNEASGGIRSKERHNERAT